MELFVCKCLGGWWKQRCRNMEAQSPGEGPCCTILDGIFNFLGADGAEALLIFHTIRGC